MVNVQSLPDCVIQSVQAKDERRGVKVAQQNQTLLNHRERETSLSTMPALR